MVEERIDEAARAENERLRAELTAARNEGDAIDQAHANETAKLRADLATERAAREMAEFQDKSTGEILARTHASHVKMMVERDAAIARAERAELSHKSDSDAFMRLFYAVNDDTTIRSISDSIARVTDLRTKLAASETARAEAEAGAAAMRAALEDCAAHWIYVIDGDPAVTEWRKTHPGVVCSRSAADHERDVKDALALPAGRAILEELALLRAQEGSARAADAFREAGMAPTHERWLSALFDLRDDLQALAAWRERGKG